MLIKLNYQLKPSNGHKFFWVKGGVIGESYNTIRGLRYRILGKLPYNITMDLTPSQVINFNHNSGNIRNLKIGNKLYYIQDRYNDPYYTSTLTIIAFDKARTKIYAREEFNNRVSIRLLEDILFNTSRFQGDKIYCLKKKPHIKDIFLKEINK